MVANPFPDLDGAGGIRIGIGLRQVPPERVDEMAIDQRVLRRDLGRRAAGHLAACPQAFDDDHRPTGLAKAKRRREPDNPGAHDNGIGMD